MLLDGINDEKMERAMVLNTASNRPNNNVVISTDPLDEEIVAEPKTTNKGFNPIS